MKDKKLVQEPAAEKVGAQNMEVDAETNKNVDANIEVSEAKIAELTNDLQRTRADFENYRKQVEVQKSQAMSVARYATVTKFLPLLDDIDRAIAAYPEQLSPLAKSFEKTLNSLSLAKINSDSGVEFNPDYHEAVSVEDEGGDTEVVAETLRSGYLYDGEVVRPAMVKVQRVSAETK